MLYNTGTIAINGNSATGTGTNWTAPASQVRAGQTIIVMSNPVQLFQISSVNSATSMTVTPAASPALSGQKYGILVSDIISVDGLAQAMSQLIKEYDENIGAWETFASTSANQSITVTINGTSVTIPAIGKLVQKGTNGAVPVSAGGSGATNEADARANLGLGSSATRNAYSTSGKMLSEGDFGIGGTKAVLSDNFSALNPSGFYWGQTNGPTFGVYFGAVIRHSNTYQLQIVGRNSRFFAQTTENNTFQGWREFTTTAISDETLKSNVINTDGNQSVSNIEKMIPVTFTFTSDEDSNPRRGFIAQQLETIDPQYIKRVNGAVDENGDVREILTLDTNPLLMDALIAINVLIKRVRALEGEKGTA